MYCPDFTAYPFLAPDTVKTVGPLRCVYIPRSIYLNGVRSTILQEVKSSTAPTVILFPVPIPNVNDSPCSPNP